MADAPRADETVATRRRRPGGEPTEDGELKVTDLRRPGWSWGWDTLAREFAALLHLKGVGLYFTYATYTDNRENSPYRGSSYTGVEALAEFTGESADDIRAINKVMAALGLARFKTYTVHTRGRDGRRGTRNRLHCYLLERDPHLRLEDALAVLRLAAADARVYKHVRHIFRPTFRPIDRAEDATGTPREHPNPWYSILPQLRRTTEWRALALKAERDLLALRERNLRGVEAAAARRRGRGAAEGGILPDTEDDAGTDLRDTEDVGVLPLSDPAGVGVLPATDQGTGSTVPATDGNHDQERHEPRPGSLENQTRAGTTTTTTRALAVTRSSVSVERGAALLLGQETDTLFQLYAQANGRPPNDIERLLLLRTAEDYDRAARGQSADQSGGFWVMSAIVEAVDAGSPFVSPKRIRRICERWRSEGFRSARPAPVDGATSKAPWLGVPEVEMPNGQSSRTVWRRVVGIARGSLDAESLITLLEPCYISRYDRWQRELEVTVPDRRTADKLRHGYGGIVERALATIFGQTTRFHCRVAGEAEAPGAEGVARPAEGPVEGTSRSAGRVGWVQTYRRDKDTPGDVEEPEPDADDVEDDDGAEGAGDDATASDENRGAEPQKTETAPSALRDLLEPVELADGCTTAHAWAAVLEALRREASPFKVRLFDAQSALVGWECDDELLVVAANGFVLDQLRSYQGVVLATLGRLLGEDELALRYTTWDRLTAVAEVEPAADGNSGHSSPP